MNFIKTQYLSWKIEQDNAISDLEPTFNDSYSIFLQEILKTNYISRDEIAFNPFKIKDICPKSFTLLEKSELLKASSAVISNLYSTQLDPHFLKSIYTQLFRVYEALEKLNISTLNIIDIVIDNNLSSYTYDHSKIPTSILAFRNSEDKTLIFYKFSIVYLLFLTDAYKLLAK